MYFQELHILSNTEVLFKMNIETIFYSLLSGADSLVKNQYSVEHIESTILQLFLNG